jgi:hypothetical protein
MAATRDNAKTELTGKASGFLAEDCFPHARVIAQIPSFVIVVFILSLCSLGIPAL